MSIQHGGIESSNKLSGKINTCGNCRHFVKCFSESNMALNVKPEMVETWMADEAMEIPACPEWES